MKYVYGPVRVVSSTDTFDLVQFEGARGIVPVPRQHVLDTDALPEGWEGYTIGGMQSSGHQNGDAEGEEVRRRGVAPALASVRGTGTWGMTSKEYREKYGLHHGVSSGALSSLHKDGLVEKLTTKRDRYGVYVAPEFVAGRSTIPHKKNKRERESL